VQIIITQRVTEEQKEGKAPIAIAKLLAPPPTQSPRAPPPLAESTDPASPENPPASVSPQVPALL